MAQMKEKVIPIVDLFAGPGGLGEGFATFQEAGRRPFGIVLSIEKENNAHSTLTLRAFFRQFEPGSIPEAYYDYLQRVDEPEPERRKCLYDAFPEQAGKAKASVLLAELGKDNPEMIREHISAALKGQDDFVLLGGPPCQPYSVMGTHSLRAGV